MSDFNVNINDKIKVKLTAKGQEILDETMRQNLKKCRLTEVCNPYKDYPDAEGYTEFQLWNFMSIFGSHFFCGAPCYIENNKIIFTADEEQDSKANQSLEAEYDAVYVKLEHLRQSIISMDLSYSKTRELLTQILQIEKQLTEMELKSDKQQKVEF